MDRQNQDPLHYNQQMDLCLRNRWAEYTAEQIVNSWSHSLVQVPQQPTLNDLDLLPSMDELTKAIEHTNSGRASGNDGIPAEIYKAAGPRAMEVFLHIIQRIWDQEKMPEDFRDALIVTLYKNKWNKADCGNYRGISLLSVAGKIFDRIVLNRLIAMVSEASLLEAQCGYRPVQWTWYLQWDRFRRNGLSRTSTFTPCSSTWSRHLTPSTERRCEMCSLVMVALHSSFKLFAFFMMIWLNRSFPTVNNQTFLHT